MTDPYDLELLQQNSPNVRRLFLERRLFGDGQVQALAECLPNCTHLERIFLSDCHVGPNGFEQILNGLRRNESVKCLNIEIDELGDQGVNALSELLRVNETLREVLICRCHVTDTQAIELANGLNENQSLLSFGLCSDKVRDDGAEAILEALQQNVALRRLYFYENRIGPRGARILANFIARNTSLQTVSVSDNPFGNEGKRLIAKSMEQNTSLHHLYFDGSRKEKATVNLLTALNKKQGRKLLSMDENDAHPCLWAYLLSKVGRGNNYGNHGPDMVFYLLRQKPGLCTSCFPRTIVQN